jgi:hypothetical protein
MHRTCKQSLLGELVELRPTGCVGSADRVGSAGSASALRDPS